MKLFKNWRNVCHFKHKNLLKLIFYVNKISCLTNYVDLNIYIFAYRPEKQMLISASTVS